MRCGQGFGRHQGLVQLRLQQAAPVIVVAGQAGFQAVAQADIQNCRVA